ncbi:hypothetical protein BDQ17DRAFT_1321692 [Cyathus striatus]|nr:hypothetical protein BDQ17DRAFT_1321692 [Cyathus striatus]
MLESESAPQDAKSPTTRIYHSYPGATYALPADEEERLRLTNQHEFLKRTFGGRILLAPVTLKDSDDVLDACTGTGIWLLELAKGVPEGVQLEGFDIEPRLFPAEESRPENVKFSVHSIFGVHQRLLVMGLRREEWPLALKELHRVTKPGGWVELCEFAKWGGGPANDQCWELGMKVVARMGSSWIVASGWNL